MSQTNEPSALFHRNAPARKRNEPGSRERAKLTGHGLATRTHLHSQHFVSGEYKTIVICKPQEHCGQAWLKAYKS